MVHLYQAYIVPLSILFPVLTALFNYRRLDASLKTILFFLFATIVLNTTAIIMSAHFISNLTVFHIYTIFEFAFISWFYKLQFKGWLSKIIPYSIVVFTVLCIVNLFFIQNKIEFNTYTRSLGAIVFIGYSLLLFNKQSADDDDQKWADKSLNWINSGILIYYASCFFTFIFSNYLLGASAIVNHIVWCVVDTVLLLEYILFGIGFYKCRKPQII